MSVVVVGLHSQPLNLKRPAFKHADRALLYHVLDEHWPYITAMSFPRAPISVAASAGQESDREAVRRLARRFLHLSRRVALRVHDRGRYFLIALPLTTPSWTYDYFLPRFGDLEGAAFVRGDQCAYGAHDHDSGHPVQRPMGWLTNSPAVANELSRRCKCPPGAHQQLSGARADNMFPEGRPGTSELDGPAAACPWGLAQAFCRGVLQQMKLDYHDSLAFDAAYPVEDAFPRDRSRSRSPPREEPHPAEDRQEAPGQGEPAPSAEAEAEAPEVPAEAPRGQRRGRAPIRREQGVLPGGRPLGFRRGRRTQLGALENPRKSYRALDLWKDLESPRERALESPREP